MARLTKEELDKIKENYHTDRIWSWSRVNTFMTSPYEYYLSYVLHANEDRTDCAYAPLGTIAHDTLDAYYEGDIQYNDMIDRFEDGWLTTIDIADLKLDRNDEEKDAKLKAKYKENLELFFRNHVTYKNKLLIEKPVIANVSGNVFVGYIDALYKDDDGFYNILDFKTSSIYKGKTLEEHAGQLTLYSIGLAQAGIPMDKIRACFNFLKYVTIQYEQKNGAIKDRTVERCKVGESLQTNAKMWLKELGYADEADDYLKMMLDANSITVLPEDVQAKYKIEDCHVYIPLDQESIDKWVNLIDTTIKDICLREKDYAENGSENAFWDTDENVEAQSYYFATLSGYSASQHKPYAAYLDKLEAKKSGMDLFGGVGDNVESDEIVSTIVTTGAKNAQDDSINLDWLDSIEI